MSKKAVDAGIMYFLKGNVVETYNVLSNIDSNFVKKRLILKVKTKELNHETAKKIWNIAFPHLIEKLNSVLDHLQDEYNSKDKAVQTHTLPKGDQNVYATLPPSRRISIDFPIEFLSWLKKSSDKLIPIDNFEMTQPWGLAAIAALARKERDKPIEVELNGTSAPGRFAFALGMNDLIQNKPAGGSREEGRTVKMQRVTNFASIEPVASEISHLLIDNADLKDGAEDYIDKEETRRTIYYVIVELLRNVIQHSIDSLGAVIVAQNMSKPLLHEKEQKIQIAVVDTGIGIFNALQSMHKEIITPEQALERALWPYFSGAFDRTKKGTSQNAGLGLFFVSEMAKLTAGTLLISSRGASLILKGDPEGEGNNTINTYGDDFPGTLVVFELPKRGVADHDALIKTIIDKAEERTAKRSKKTWFKYDLVPANAYEFSISHVVENTVEAERFSTKLLIPKIESGIPVVVNFENLKICTQSFMHALLFNALRLACKNQVELYAINASPAVRDGIRLLEIYAADE